MEKPEQPTVWPPAPTLPPPESADPPKPTLLVIWLIESAWISAIVLGVDVGLNVLGHGALPTWKDGAIIIATVTTFNGAKYWLKDRKQRVRAENRRTKVGKRRTGSKL